jgi:hypothetical protein
MKLSPAVRWLERDYDHWRLYSDDFSNYQHSEEGLSYYQVYDSKHGRIIERPNSSPMFELRSDREACPFRYCIACEDAGTDMDHALHNPVDLYRSWLKVRVPDES